MGRSLLVIAATGAVTALAALVCTAVALSTADAPVLVHGRSGFYVFGTSAATLAWLGAIVLTRSVSISFAGGVFAGGSTANLAAVLLWPSIDGVPDPMTAGDVAFNLADVAVAVGLVLVLATTVGFAVRNRARLHERVPATP
ncbi:MAG TPA: hypothetical protein VKB07_10130 [Gaiellaceae bacterium]|nr:hypothetical protein [Gaiellaceae bacterium]